jgi:hypothetical protein
MMMMKKKVRSTTQARSIEPTEEERRERERERTKVIIAVEGVAVLELTRGRLLAGDQLVDDHAKREDVRRLVIALAHGNLGSHPAARRRAGDNQPTSWLRAQHGGKRPHNQEEGEGERQGKRTTRWCRRWS